MRSGIPVGDLGGGLFGAMAVLAALVARSSTGRGQHVDVSMLDVQISMLNYMATMYLMSGIVPGRLGNGHFVHVPYNTYRTQTNHIIIACIGDAFFKQILEVFDRPELRGERYLHQPAGLADKDLIDRVIEEELLTHTADHWLAKLRAARIPRAPVNDCAQALDDAQVKARHMVVEAVLQSGDVVKMPGNPIKLSDAPDEVFTAPPLLGEQIAALRQTGVIQ